MNASLIMQDQETDSYWSIMAGKAIAGELAGNELNELPVGKRTRWKEWVELHPDTLVLSVNGKEDVRINPYQKYFHNDSGFGGTEAKDKRLETKEPIYAFQYREKKYAVPFEAIEDGRVFTLEEGQSIFLYRPKKSDPFESTVGFLSNGAGFENKDGVWIDVASGARYIEEEGDFVGGTATPLAGFDTFWYTWSLSNPDTEVLR